MWNINAPKGRIPRAIFTKFAVSTSFQDALAVKNFVGFAQGVMELWGF